MNHYDDGYEEPPCSTQDLRNISDLVRRIFDIDPEKPFPVCEFIEFALYELFDDFKFEICTKAEMREKHGETLPGRHLIRLREDVYDGMCEGVGQHRYTAAHEIAHLLKHEHVPVAMARRRAEHLPLFRNSEWQADTLAAELLMPFSAVRFLTAPEIEDRFLVSSSAARVRFNKLQKEAARRSNRKKTREHNVRAFL